MSQIIYESPVFLRTLDLECTHTMRPRAKADFVDVNRNSVIFSLEEPGCDLKLLNPKSDLKYKVALAVEFKNEYVEVLNRASAAVVRGDKASALRWTLEAAKKLAA